MNTQEQKSEVSKMVKIEESMDTSSTKSSIFKTISDRGDKR